MFVFWDICSASLFILAFFEMASSSVARGLKLSSYGATSASSLTSPKKVLLSEELDDEFDGKHIHIMQRLALCFQLFIILFSGLCCGNG